MRSENDKQRPEALAGTAETLLSEKYSVQKKVRAFILTKLRGAPFCAFGKHTSRSMTPSDGPVYNYLG